MSDARALVQNLRKLHRYFPSAFIADSADLIERQHAAVGALRALLAESPNQTSAGDAARLALEQLERL